METIRLFKEGDKLMWSVRLDSYHFRLSTDKLGCVVYGTVNATALSNFHAVNLSGLEGSKCAFLSVGPAADPTKEQYSAFLELGACDKTTTAPPQSDKDKEYNVRPKEVTGKLAPFEPLKEVPGVFNIIATIGADEFSISANSLSPSAAALGKYVTIGMPVKIVSSSTVLPTKITSVIMTESVVMLSFSDSLCNLFTSDNTVRVPNLSLRSDPPNPREVVSPWNQSTITEPYFIGRPIECVYMTIYCNEATPPPEHLVPMPQIVGMPSIYAENASTVKELLTGDSTLFGRCNLDDEVGGVLSADAAGHAN